MATLERTGVCVVRVWTEGGSRQLVARVTARLDVAVADDIVTTAADVEAVLAAVRTWLEAFAAGAGDGDVTGS